MLFCGSYLQLTGVVKKQITVDEDLSSHLISLLISVLFGFQLSNIEFPIMESTCAGTINITVKQETQEVNNLNDLSSFETELDNNIKTIEFESVFLKEVKTESTDARNCYNGNTTVKTENEEMLHTEKGKPREYECKDHIKIEEHERQEKIEFMNDTYNKQIKSEAEADHLLNWEKIEVEKHELPENCITFSQKSKNPSNKRKNLETDFSSNDNTADINKKCIRKLKQKPAEDEFYVCKHCNRNYKRKADLTVHINIKHKEGVENYFHKCKHCEYRSPYLQHINRHEKDKHINEKNISCPKCSYVTTRNSSLKLHMNTHLQSNIYKCKFCDYETKLSYVLATHISNKHSEMI